MSPWNTPFLIHVFKRDNTDGDYAGDSKMARSWKLELIWGGLERYLHLIINAPPRPSWPQAELTYGASH